MLELASERRSPRRAQRSTGPRATRRYATCRRVSRSRGTRRFHAGRRLARSATRRRGIDPQSDRLSFPCSAGASCTPDTSNAPRHALLVVSSRAVRVPWIARTDRVCSGRGGVRSPGVQTALGIDHGREPPRPALEVASPALWKVACPARHGLQAFPSLCWVRAKGRGAEPPRVQSDWDAATGPVG